MANHEARDQRASARKLRSEHRPQFPQPPRPGTPFSVPLHPRQKKWHRRPGTPFSVPEWDDGPSHQWGKLLASPEDQWDFPLVRVIPLTRRKFRCLKLREDKTFKLPDTVTAHRLQTLRTLTKISTSKKKQKRLKYLKGIREGKLLIPLEIAECRNNPMSRQPKPKSALRPDTRKRLASTSVLILGKVLKSLNMSTMFEQPMDFNQSGTTVPDTSSRCFAGEASEKSNAEYTVLGPSSADSSTEQPGQVISPHIQGFLQHSPPTQGALGPSTSSQDAQGLSLSTEEVQGGAQCDPGAMGHSTSATASQRPPSFPETKIKQFSSFRKRFRNTSSTQGITRHPKCFSQASSDQGSLPQGQAGKEGSKPSSVSGGLCDSSFSQNSLSVTTSPQRILTALTAAKHGWSATPPHEDSQVCSPSPPKYPKQSTSADVSLSPTSSHQGNFITSPLKQEGFKCPPTLTNVLRSSLRSQRGLRSNTIPQVSLTLLIPAEAERKLSTHIPEAQGPLPSLEGALESSTCSQEVLRTHESFQGTLGPSQHTLRALEPSPSSPGVLSPSIYVEEAPGLSLSRGELQRPILSHKRRFKPNPAKQRYLAYSHCSRGRWRDPPSEQGDFTVTLLDQEGFKYTLVAKKALLTHDRDPNSRSYSKNLHVSHTSSTSAQDAETTQPSPHPQGSLDFSTSVGQTLEVSTYTLGTPGHFPPVQHTLGPTLADKVTVGQGTSTKGVSAASTSLEMALGYDTSRKDVPGHSLSVLRVLYPTQCDRGHMGYDTCTQESAAMLTSRIADSLDFTCTQGPPRMSQEAEGTSPGPQEVWQSVKCTQEVSEPFQSAQTAVSPSKSHQVSPENPPNTPKALNSTLCPQGTSEPVSSVQLALEGYNSIQKSASPSPPEPSVPGTSTYTQRALLNSLPAPEAVRLSTATDDALGETTPTQEALVPSPPAKAVVKKHTCALDTLAPPPSEKENPGSTTTQQSALPSSPFTREGVMRIPSQEGNIRQFPSAQVDPGHPISTKKRLRSDPSGQGDFRPSSSEGHSFNILPFAKRVHASSLDPKETSKTTSTPQLNPTLSLSVQKNMKCSTSDQMTVGSCLSIQGSSEHSSMSQDKRGLSLSDPKFYNVLQYSPSDPGLQRHFLSLSQVPENTPHAQGASSLSKSDLGPVRPSVSDQGSEGKSTCIQRTLGCVPLAQRDLTSPMSCQASKNPSVSCLLAAEGLPNPLGIPVPSPSYQGYIGTSSSAQVSLGCSPSAPVSLSCFQSAQRPLELLSSAQETQQSLPSSLSESGSMPHLPGDVRHSSLEQGILGLVPPAQCPMETSSCSPGVSLQRPFQRPLDLPTPTQGAAGPSTQAALGSLLSFPSKSGTSHSAKDFLSVFPSAQAAMEISPSASVALGSLPMTPQPLDPRALSQETSSHLPHVHRHLEFFQYGSRALTLMPSKQWHQGSLSSSKVSTASVHSAQGSVGHSLSGQESIEISKSTQGTPGHSLSGQGDMPPFLSSQGPLGRLPSVEVETYSHALGSPGHLKNVSGFSGPGVFDHDTVAISLPAQGTLRPLSSPQADVGHSMSAQRAPERSTWEHGTVAHLEKDLGTLISTSCSQGARGHCLCDQESVERLLPSIGALKISSANQESHGHLTSAQETSDILPSNSDAVAHSPSGTGGLDSFPPAPSYSGQMLSEKGSEKYLMCEHGSLGNSLSTKEIQEHLAPSVGSLKPCQSDEQGLRNLTPSPSVLEHASDFSGVVAALSSALGNMTLYSSEKESPEHTQYVKESVESSSSATGSLGPMAFHKNSSENSLCGQGIIDRMPSSQEEVELFPSIQGAVELSSSTKERAGNISSSERPVNPPTSLTEASRPSPLTPDPHQNSLSATESLQSVSSGQRSQRPLLSARESVQDSLCATDAQKTSPSTSQALESLVTPQGPLQISTPDEQTPCPLPSTLGHVEHFSSFIGLPRGAKHFQNVPGPLSTRGESVESSLTVLGSRDISMFIPGPSQLSSLEKFTLSLSPCPPEPVGSSLSEQGSLEPSSFVQDALRPSATTPEAGEPSLSVDDTLYLSVYAPGTEAHLTSTLGSSASKHDNQMEVGLFPCFHGDLIPSLSDQRTLGMTKSPERAVENLLSGQGPMKHPTSNSQEANKSDQVHIPHECITEALGPALSDCRAEESMLCHAGNVEHPPSTLGAQVQKIIQSIPGSQDTFLTPEQHPKFSISAPDTLYPLPATLDDVEFSTSSPECLRTSQSANRELGYFKAVGQAIDYSETASQTKRSLFSTHEYGGLSSSSLRPWEPSQSEPGAPSHLPSSQGPQENSILTQGMLAPSASAQESPETSESSKCVLRTQQSSQRIHEYIIPVIEPVDTFASVSGTTVSSQSTPQLILHSSVLPVTSASILHSEKTLAESPSDLRTLQNLTCPEGDVRNSQLEKDSVEQSISAKVIVGSSPSTTGALGSTTYAHRKAGLLPSSTQEYTKHSVSPQGDLGLPLSANGPLGYLPSHQRPRIHSDSFHQASRHSLFIQSPLGHSPSAVEALRSSCNQQSEKPLLSSPGAVKASLSSPHAQKTLQTTLGAPPTMLPNQGPQEQSISVQGTLGSFSSSSGTLDHTAPSPLVLGPSAYFQSKEGQLCSKVESQDTPSSVQRTTGHLAFPSRTTGHLHHEQRTQGSSLSVSRDLAHLLSKQLCMSAQGTRGTSSCVQQSQQHSAFSPEIQGPSMSAQCTHENFSSVSHALGKSPYAPVTIGPLPHDQVTPGLFQVIRASPAPSPCLQKDDGSFQNTQGTLELNTMKNVPLEPTESTQVPGQSSLDAKPTLWKSISAQGIEGQSVYITGTLGSYQQSNQKEVGVCPPAHLPLVTFLSSQGTLGTSSSAQEALGKFPSSPASLKLSSPTQGMVGIVPSAQIALKHPTSSLEAPRSFPSTQPTVQGSLTFPEATVCAQSKEKIQATLLASSEYVEHSLSSLGAKEHPLSVPGTLGPKKLSTVTEGSCHVHSTLSSIQRTPESSLNTSGSWGQHQYFQSTLGPLPHVGEGVESSHSAPGTMGPLTSPIVPGGHSIFPQGATGIISSEQEALKLSISAQEVLHTSLCAEGALPSTASSAAVPGQYKKSPSTQVIGRTYPSASGHMGLSASTQATPSSSHFDEGVARLCQLAQRSLTKPKSAHGSVEFSPSPQHTGGHFLSAEGTRGVCTYAQQTVGTMLPNEGTLGSPQINQLLFGCLPLDQTPLGISLSAEGTLTNDHASERPAHASLHPTAPLRQSVYPQITLATLLSHEGSTKHGASSQIPQRISQSAQNSLQHPTSVPGYPNPSKSGQNTQGSLSYPPGKGTQASCVPGSQKMFSGSANSWYNGPLIFVTEPLKLSLFTQGTLCPISSPLGDLDPLDSFSDNLESSQPSQKNLGHLSYGREPVENSPSVSGHRELSPFDKVPTGLSSHVPSDPAPLLSPCCSPQLGISAKCSLRSLALTNSLESLSSYSGILGTLQSAQRCQGQLLHVGETFEHSPTHVGSSVYVPCSSDPQGLSSLEQGSQANSHCVEGAVGSCLSTQVSIGQPTSTQISLGHPPSAQGLSSTPLHIQGTGSKSTSEHSTVAHSPSTPVSHRYTHHAQNVLGTLKYAQWSPKISPTAQGQNISEPTKVTLGQSPPQQGSQGNSSSTQGAEGLSASSKESLGYLSFTQGSLETPTTSHKVVGPSYYQETLALFPSVPGDGLSPSAQGMLRTLPSSQVSLESSSSVQRSIKPSLDVQGDPQLQPHSLGSSQCNPKASEKLPSSQVALKISESSPRSLGTLQSLPGTMCGQGAVCPCHFDEKFQGTAMSLQETLPFFPSSKRSLGPTPSVPGILKSLLSDQLGPELSMSPKGFKGTSTLQKGCTGHSPSTQVSLVNSLSSQECVGNSKPDQGSPETCTSSQEDLGPFLIQKSLAQSSYAPGDCVLSQSSEASIDTSQPSQGSRVTTSSAQGSVESAPFTQHILGIQAALEGPQGPSQLTKETVEPLSIFQEVYHILKSVNRTLEIFCSILEAMKLSPSD